MTEELELDVDTFVERFRPVPNHLNPDAPYSCDGNNGALFETYGEEYAFVRSYPTAHIWTLVATQDGDYLVSGNHYVNRSGYVLTELPVPDKANIVVSL